MLKRTIVGIVALPILFAALFFLPIWCVSLIMAAISVLSVYELLWATGHVRDKFIIFVACIFAALVPFWAIWCKPMWVAVIGTFVFVFLLFCYGIFNPENFPYAKLAGVVLAGVIVPFFYSMLIPIAMLDHGKEYVLIPFIIAWASDILAYFCGTLFGKHPLIPKISAKKTVEGTVAGVFGAALAMVLYALVLRFGFGLNPNFLLCLAYGVIGAGVSQIGDLAMSYIKRGFHIKDYGHILPGHGGILDRFDSILFVLPVVYTALILVPIL